MYSIWSTIEKTYLEKKKLQLFDCQFCFCFFKYNFIFKKKNQNTFFSLKQIFSQ